MGNIRKGLLLFLSLLVASASIAAPTVSDYNRDVAAPTLSLISDASHIESYEINQIGEPTNSHLASVAAEFLKPPVATDLQALSISAKSLPAVPGALFMALSGFLCVSLVRDRRVWFAALAGLLWLGQAGFAALPQLASHLCSKKQIQQQSPASLTYVSELEGSFRLRSDLKGTQYIGVLRHLAGIPNPEKILAAIIFESYNFNLLLKCSAVRTEQIVSFSPAFIFARLARGPPELASYVIPAQAGIQ